MSTLVSLVSSEVHFIHEEAEECQSLLYTVLFTVIAVTVSWTDYYIRNIGILLLALLLILLSLLLFIITITHTCNVAAIDCRVSLNVSRSRA